MGIFRRKKSKAKKKELINVEVFNNLRDDLNYRVVTDGENGSTVLTKGVIAPDRYQKIQCSANVNFTFYTESGCVHASDLFDPRLRLINYFGDLYMILGTDVVFDMDTDGKLTKSGSLGTYSLNIRDKTVQDSYTCPHLKRMPSDAPTL